MSEVSAVDAAALFDGSRLTLARHLAGLRKSQLAHLVDKSPTAVAGWESGTKRPAASTVAELSLGLGVDPGFFAVRPESVAVQGGAPHFRSLRSTTQVARDQATAFGLLAVDIANALERHVEFPEPTIPRRESSSGDAIEGSPEEAARFVRNAWRLEDGPVGHLVRLLENHGAVVVYSPPGAPSVDAYSFDSQVRPVVVLNPHKRDYYRQRFDAAHELGHLVMHSDTEPGGRLVENQANRFAAELLMPEMAIAELLPTSMGRDVWTQLGRVKEQWGVSMQALLFRARTLGCLSDVSYRNAMTTVSARGWRRQEPGLVTMVEQPSLLPRAIDLLAEVGVSADQLATECRIPRGLFQQVVSRVPTTQVGATAIESEKFDSATVVSMFRSRR